MRARTWLWLSLAMFVAAVPARAAAPESSAPAALSAAEKAELKAEYDKLFAELLKRPADLDLMFQFASVAARLGNDEAAISTLERMLLFNRDLPRVKLELGALYLKIGSYSIARSYFEQAIAGKDVPDSVKKRVKTYLAEIDKRAAGNHFAGSVTAGFRYQTNANVGPSSNQVLAAGFPAILNSTFLTQPDWNAFISGHVTDSYDLNAEKSRTWDSTLQAYYAQQFQLTNLNLGFVEGTTGPRFVLSQDQGKEASVRPFFLANAVTLGNESDFETVGGGLELNKAFAGDRLQLNAGYTYRYQFYQDSTDLPTNDEFTGPVNLVGLNGSYLLTDTIQLSLGAYFSNQSANADFNSNNQYSVFGAIGKRYPAPFALNPYPWETDLSVRGTWTDYEAPNPAVDPSTDRSDVELHVTLTNIIPLTSDLSLLLLADYTNHHSNLPNYQFDDTSVAMGVTWSF